ncbi:MAG: DNA polymerase III subunit alpha [Clostridia bacterium]|nr:DNA polymerase III subunit alpha [Clostridia bacterium]
MSEFVHLHIHSEFSLLDGANRIKDLPVRAKELGMNAMAITDHGVMYGAIDFYKACKKEGIKPIIGCEVYVAPRSRLDKEPGIDNKYNHLILLAKNNQGYKNLSKLVSIGFVEGYYYKPRIDLEVLEKYHEGLICLSACLAGSVNQALLNGQTEKAEEIALWHKNLFGEDYYIEIQNNGIPEQTLANQKLVKLARKLDIPLVATNDAHYLRREDSYSHEVLLCIQTGKKISDEDRMKFETDELYVKSPEEMSEYFANFPDAIENTVKIAQKCNVEFEFGHTILPNYDVPEGFETHYDYLEKLCYDGLKKRYGENLSQEITDRAEYELGVVKNMGYVDYFLIVWDFIHYAKEHDIPVGPGRGSGAGSILAYAIEITDIDPIKYGLIFERFLNPERISMPDFDVDFSDAQRQEVIDYVSNKYGHSHVSQIITFGTMAAKMVIRDVARVLEFPYAEADKLAKMIPNELHITIKKALEQNKELSDLYENDNQIKNLLDIAMKLEGMPRQASTHACGVIIAKEPVDNYVPLYVRDGQISTQYIMTTLEELGLLKMDFLGLRTLTVIKDTIELVKKTRGIDVKFDDSMDDPKVFKLWQDGNTMGLFQFESQGMTNFMKELKPDCLEDLIAGVSLYRPGPMDQIPRYIKGKLNPGHNEYTHPSLEPILNVTYGCMVYQEQVMQIVRDLAGYSLGRADLVRRAMGKKKLDVMAKEREVFINGQVDEKGIVVVPGCVRNGIDAESANKIFDEMAEFAKYAFNKSHAACYAVVAYRTGYLKAYYPAEFMASMLNSFLGNLDKIPQYIDECKRLNIEILKPEINKSYTKFTVEREKQEGSTQGGKIRFGLGSIKNVGTVPVNNIVKERTENGNFKSFTDFCERVVGEAVNKKCIESLIKAGVFDEFNQTRSTLLASFENIVDIIQTANKKGIDGQVSMFDLGGESSNQTEKVKYTFYEQPEMSEKELLSTEKEMLGMYISGHPLEKIKEQIKLQTNINSLEIKALDEVNMIQNGEMMTENEVKFAPEVMQNNGPKFQDGQIVKIAGIITSIKKKYTKNNKIMAFVTIEDLYGQVELIIFENAYLSAQNSLIEENIILVEGRLSIREDEETKIVANKICDFEVKKKKALSVDITNLTDEVKLKLKGLIKFFNGDKNNLPVFVNVNGELKSCGQIYCNDEILQIFKQIIGNENIDIIEL